ncbi:MAG: carbonic anhydrase [Salinirussus sp.]
MTDSVLPTLVDLLAGNADHAEQFTDQFDGLQDAQRPEAVTVTCADSRVLSDHLWGNHEPGRLFTCNTIGNRVTQRIDGDLAIAGDVLYPLLETGTELAIVVGHTGCGAVTATYEAVTTGETHHAPGIAHCLEVLQPDIAPAVERLPSSLNAAAAVNHLVEFNVDRQVTRLVESEEIPDTVTVVGVVYDFQDVYSSRRGMVHLTNVDGERDPERLRTEYPGIADRVSRQWNY